MALNWQQIGRRAGIVLVLSVLFTWLGVYNQGGVPAYKQFTLWVLTIGVGLTASAFIAPQIFNTAFEAVPLWLRILIAAAAISLPVTAMLVVVMVADGRTVPWAAMPSMYVYVLVISVVITTGHYFVSRAVGGAGGPALEAGPGAGAGAAVDPTRVFMDRLPVKYRTATLYAVSSEDHYLRVHTELGEALILLRLADALRDLDGAEGLQVHRSWWVAHGGVADAKRVDGKLVLTLKTGTDVPVSRTYAKAVREVGLI